MSQQRRGVVEDHEVDEVAAHGAGHRGDESEVGVVERSRTVGARIVDEHGNVDVALPASGPAGPAPEQPGQADGRFGTQAAREVVAQAADRGVAHLCELSHRGSNVPDAAGNSAWRIGAGWSTIDDRSRNVYSRDGSPYTRYTLGSGGFRDVTHNRLPIRTRRGAGPRAGGGGRALDRRGAGSCADHLHQGHRAHPAALLPGVPPYRLDRPDVAPHLRGDAALGAVDPREGRHPLDAAVVHRPQHRHPGLQVRLLAERRGDRHGRRLGRQRRAARQPRGPAAAARVPGHRRVEDRRAGLGGRDSRRRSWSRPRRPTGGAISSPSPA